MPQTISIPQLGGAGTIQVAANEVFRVSVVAPADQVDGALSQVEWGGHLQITSLTIDALAALVMAGGVRLCTFHVGGNTEVFLNPSKVSAIGPALHPQYPSDLQTLITVGGKPQPVRESQEEVRKAIAAATD